MQALRSSGNCVVTALARRLECGSGTVVSRRVPVTWSPIPHKHLLRSYAVYPEFYLKPIFRADEQDKLRESGELAKISFLPVKPAATNETSSVFYDALVNKFINHIMVQGDKKLARSLLEQTFETIKRVQLDKYHAATDPSVKESIILNPYVLLHTAVKNATPMLETTPVKRGGHTYQVPVPIREKKALALAIKWLIEAGKEKDDDMRFYKKLAYEIIETAANTGRVIKRKQDLHRLCEANRAYAHYRWG